MCRFGLVASKRSFEFISCEFIGFVGLLSFKLVTVQNKYLL